MMDDRNAVRNGRDGSSVTKSWLAAFPAGPVWLRNACTPAVFLDDPVGPADDEGLVRFDLRIDGNRVVAVSAPGAGTAGAVTEGVDLDGGQVWPGFVDAHVHLDKTQTWARAPNLDGTHPGARAAFAVDRSRWTDADVEARFAYGLECAHAHGTVAMRTQLDSYWPHAKIGWRVFRRLRDEWADRITLQASSICPLDRFLGEDGVALADEIAMSGGVLGMVTTGIGDPDRPLVVGIQDQLDRFFTLAEERGLALDLHLDETGDAQAETLRLVAMTALRRNFRLPIQCAHCCSLAVQSEQEATETIRLCAEIGLSIVVLPACNMYLQGRGSGRTPRWRGITLVHEFKVAGVPVSFASDNCRDPFYPYGDHDMFEVYRDAVRIAQLDHPFGDWAAAVSTMPAAMLGLSDRGKIAVGKPADLVLFRARGMTELMARPQSDRVVLRNGRVSNVDLPDFRTLDRLCAPA
jgi:cytosine deaminase